MSEVTAERKADATLSMTPDQMREFGYRVVDMLVDHFDTLSDEPAASVGGRPELGDLLIEPIPEHGTDPNVLLDRVRRDVLRHTSHIDHPRFFGFIPSPSNFVGAMADALASGYNVFAGSWLGGSGASMIELITVDWLRQLCGMPESTGGLFTSGGSAANMTALTVARCMRLNDDMHGAVIYVSDQTHSSVQRGVRILGFPPEAYRILPTGESLTIDMPALRRAVAEDRSAGRRPFCVVANAGSTNTGAVDPLHEIADLCDEEDLWMHVDAAYGAGAVLSDRGRAAMAGLERAHSVTLDPHKWFFQPYEIGCLLVRERKWLPATFAVRPEYLKDTERSDAREINFAEHGMQLTRSFRALKLWMSLKTFGLEAFRGAVDHGFRLAEVAEREVRALPEWEVVTPATLGIVSFRFAPAGASEDRREVLNSEILRRSLRDGFAALSSTSIHGRSVLRMCTINPRTTEDDVRETVRRLGEIAGSLENRSSGP